MSASTVSSETNVYRLLSIGFSTQKVTLTRLPGWEPESWAYHGDDGQVFNSNQHGKPYGPKYGNGDTIGCGINFRTGIAFFTRNGVNLGE
jgi:Ran-binding protein 9/10